MKKLYIVISLILLSSCDKGDFLELESFGSIQHTLSYVADVDAADDNERLVLGKKLENPYSVENMRNAFTSIKTRGVITPSMGKITEQLVKEMALLENGINTTHYYVKFNPSSLEDLEVLESDTTLVLYSYPLDYEILGEGEFPAEDVLLDEVTGAIELVAPLNPLYTVVPITKELPATVDYEILENLYIPIVGDEELATRSATPMISEELADILIDQSLYITGNESLIEIETRGRSKWKPSGRIRVYDTELERYIGVANVKVRAFNTLGVASDYAYTDENGNFFINKKFKRKVRYEIIWETKKWDIRNGSYGQARYKGPKQREAWNFDIPRSGKTYGYATITRALSSHFYGNVGFDPTKSSHKTKVAYRHEYSDKSLGKFYYPHLGGITPTLAIYGVDKQNNCRESPSMLKTVFHELAHCSMYHKCKSSYDKFDLVIRESWATMVGWYMLNAEYYNAFKYVFPKYIQYDYETGGIIDPYNELAPLIVSRWVYFEIPSDYNLQSMSKELYNSTDNDRYWQKYTPLFVDIVDNSNQKEYYRIIKKDNNTVYPDDDLFLTPQSFPKLQEVLYESRSITALKENLLKERSWLGLSEEKINNYFKFYEK